MSDTFNGIITADGKKRQLPYGSILDKPVSDETLSIQGGFADAKVTGDNFAKAKAETDSLKEDLDELDSQLSGSIADISNGLIGYENLTSFMVKDKAFMIGDYKILDINDESKIIDAKDWCYLILDCKVGDYFSIYSGSASGYKAYAILDKDGNVLETKYSTNNNYHEVYHFEFYIPQGASHIIINSYTNGIMYCVKKGITSEMYKKYIENKNDSIISPRVVNSWDYDTEYYLSSAILKLYRPNHDAGFRSCVLSVNENDVIYYSGSNYTDSKDTVSAARPFGFFDEDGNLISFAESGIYRNHKIVIPNNVKYLVLNQHNYHGYSDCYIGYMPQEQSDDIDMSAINRTLKIVDAYMDDSFHYNSEYSPWYYKDSYGDKRGLTCSDWGMISFFGIDRRYTRWNGSRNIVGCGFDSFQELFALKSDRDSQSGGIWSEQIAKYIDENYLSYTPNDDLSNVKPGDLFFYDMDSENDNDDMFYPPTGETLKRYKGVDHCAVVTHVVSNDYYAVLEVVGSETTDIGYPSYRYIQKDARKIVTALRPKSYVKYEPKTIAEIHNTRCTKINNFTITLEEVIPKGTWISVVVDADRISDSYIGVQAKYVDSDSFVTVSTESSFGRAKTPKDTTTFLFHVEKPIKEILIISFGNSEGTLERGMYLHDVEIYDGFKK